MAKKTNSYLQHGYNGFALRKHGLEQIFKLAHFKNRCNPCNRWLKTNFYLQHGWNKFALRKHRLEQIFKSAHFKNPYNPHNRWLKKLILICNTDTTDSLCENTDDNGFSN